jgi:transcriptional regulator with XRE-family HTH domain
LSRGFSKKIAKIIKKFACGSTNVPYLQFVNAEFVEYMKQICYTTDTIGGEEMIGKRIKARRKEIRLSVTKLAEMLGKDRGTVYRYEKGEIENLPLDVLEPLAAALQTTPAWLMGWEEKNDTLADVIMILREDEDLVQMTAKLARLAPEKRDTIRGLLDILSVDGK